MPTNIPQAAPILYSTGLAMNPNLIGSGVNGTNVSPGHVYRPIPGLVLTALTTGQFALNHPGIRGTIEAEIITGPLGAGGTVLQLQTSATDSTQRVRIDLNDSNCPEFAIFNGGGSAVTSWTPGGTDIPEGTPLQIRLVWDSGNLLVPGGLHVSFADFSGAAFEGDWDPEPPVTPWTMGPLQSLLVGYGDAEYPLTVRQIQIGMLA